MNSPCSEFVKHFLIKNSIFYRYFIKIKLCGGLNSTSGTLKKLRAQLTGADVKINTLTHHISMYKGEKETIRWELKDARDMVRKYEEESRAGEGGKD